MTIFEGFAPVVNSSDEGNSEEDVKRRKKKGHRQQNFSEANDDSWGDAPWGSDPVNVDRADPHNSFEPFTLDKGEYAELGLEFSVFKAVRNYPYTYVGKANTSAVSTYFDENLFKSQDWDLFYLVDPEKRRLPIVLVSAKQFAAFLAQANKDLNMKLTIPGGKGNMAKFKWRFSNAKLPRPQYLHRVQNRVEFDGLRSTLESLKKDFKADSSGPEMEAYKETMNSVYKSIQGGSKSKSKNEVLRQQNRSERQKGWGRQTKRVQRYLGLRTRTAYKDTNVKGEQNGGWSVDLPPPFDTESEVRFVCVDVECDEQSHGIITEIGIATFSADEVKGKPPGERGENWFDLIRPHHLWIDEYKHIRNQNYVQGCPERYNFGDSEMISKIDLPRKLGEIIREDGFEDKSHVVIVGHGLTGDLNYLANAGFNVWEMPQFLDEIDTQFMFQRAQYSLNPRRLGLVCSELDIPGQNFHNAGNDAVYTLRAMIAMAVMKKVGQTPGAVDTFSGSDKEKAEWTDGELDDGLAAVKSKDPRPKHGSNGKNAEQGGSRQSNTKASPQRQTYW